MELFHWTSLERISPEAARQLEAGCLN